ncbi:MAG: hypothetical protein GXO66_02190 [Euryarchaeota archaeon]|nr:hypothetical protein [Euryarchaeota archaeon]
MEKKDVEVIDLDKLAREANKLDQKGIPIISLLEKLYNTIIESEEHILNERRKIREKYPRLEPFVGLAAPEIAALLDKIKKKDK